MLRVPAILGVVFASCALAGEPVLLGVLEEPQCAKERGVGARIMFVSERARWESLALRDASPTLDVTERKWTVALDGRSLGTVTLENSSSPGAPQVTDWYYTRDKLFVPGGNYPSVNNLESFAGWCEAPSRRPLVLVSHSMIRDPAGWKPLAISNGYRRKLYQPMKLALGTTNVFRCRDPEGLMPEPFDFQPEDLKLYKVYRSKTEGILVSIGLDPEGYGCDGVTEPAWLAHWFLLHDAQVDLIGTGMELVDAGDYDGDGRSEVLFWKSGYNRDGYLLVFDGLRQKAEYTWSYH